MIPSIHAQDALLDRIGYAVRTKKTVTFLVGSPLSAGQHSGEKGVPDVDGMIELIKEEFAQEPAGIDALERSISSDPLRRYQTAFEFLVARRGQSLANLLVRRAVLNARVDNDDPVDIYIDDKCEALERDVDGWFLPPGVRALSDLLVALPDALGRVVLTSNFDPLIEVGIQRSSGDFLRTVLHRDGNLGQTVGKGCNVVHLHGYWYGSDTLHTTRQLTQERPQLANSLRSLLQKSTLVIVGYGGWDDVFTRALMNVVNDDTAYPEVVWTFRENDSRSIAEKHASLLDNLSPGMNRERVTLYGGIDCHDFFPILADELRIASRKVGIQIAPGVTSQLVEDDAATNAAHVEIKISLPPQRPADRQGDHPPSVDVWVGRSQEMALLRGSDFRVAMVTGLGGQGKSTLAATYLNDAIADSSRFEFWDWRDCKEEGDRIHTQLVSIIERLSAGSISPDAIKELSIKGVVKLFFEVLGTRTSLFVFDNVDHYIDLQTLQPVKGLKEFFDAAISMPHASQFIFTCRPQVRHENPTALSLPLGGLSLAEVRELLEIRGARPLEDRLVQEVFSLTQGHPMWTSLIAVQSTRRGGGLVSVLEDINRGHGELPENTLRSIWSTLNDVQRNVLRTLAELERAEPEDKIPEIVEAKTWGRVVRALKTLKSLSLIVVKPQSSGTELLELHPMVREFIRAEYPRKDRERFISVVLNFVDRMIGRYKELLPKSPSISVLEHWVHKAELEINRGGFEVALATLDEVKSALIDRGFPEEFVRVTRRLLARIDWGVACVSYRHFDQVFSQAIKLMTEFGSETEVDELLSRYEESIPGRSAQYINLADMRTYAYWYRKDYAQAVFWGETGERLVSGSKVDTKFSTAHNLALARRDSGNTLGALKYFLHGHRLEDVTSEKEPDPSRGGHFYGNIDRCLYFQDNIMDALNCYRLAARILEKKNEPSDSLNRGYARYWVGECWERMGDFGAAYCAFRSAVKEWQISSPPRAEDARRAAARLLSSDVNLEEMSGLEQWRFESFYKHWVETSRTDITILFD